MSQQQRTNVKADIACVVYRQMTDFNVPTNDIIMAQVDVLVESLKALRAGDRQRIVPLVCDELRKRAL